MADGANIEVKISATGGAQAAADVREAGGLTAFVYSTDERFIADAEDAFARAGSQLTVNLTGPMPLNFAAAYSDGVTRERARNSRTCLTPPRSSVLP